MRETKQRISFLNFLYPTENFSLIKALSFSRNLPERSTEAGTSSEFQIGAKTLFQL
jgi:hypothetical protein